MLLMAKSTISMAIFNSYGSLPEGMRAEAGWRPGVIHIMVVDGMAGWIPVRSDLYADEG